MILRVGLLAKAPANRRCAAFETYALKAQSQTAPADDPLAASSKLLQKITNHPDYKEHELDRVFLIICGEKQIKVKEALTSHNGKLYLVYRVDRQDWATLTRGLRQWPAFEVGYDRAQQRHILKPLDRKNTSEASYLKLSTTAFAPANPYIISRKAVMPEVAKELLDKWEYQDPDYNKKYLNEAAETECSANKGKCELKAEITDAIVRKGSRTFLVHTIEMPGRAVNPSVDIAEFRYNEQNKTYEIIDIPKENTNESFMNLLADASLFDYYARSSRTVIMTVKKPKLPVPKIKQF